MSFLVYNAHWNEQERREGSIQYLLGTEVVVYQCLLIENMEKKTIFK